MRSVYMMKASHDLYKVGIAEDVHKRLKGLQTSNGSKVHLITHARCGEASGLERNIHLMLAEYRQPGGREWFKLTPEQAIKVCIYIQQHAQPYYEENEIKDLLGDYADVHEAFVNAQKDLDNITEKMGQRIQKAIGQLHKYKPAPKVIKPKLEYKNFPKVDLLKNALDVIKKEQAASTSLLQRHLRIGYGRASRLMDELERKGFVGPADGARRRVVLVNPSDEEITKAVDNILSSV